MNTLLIDTDTQADAVAVQHYVATLGDVATVSPPAPYATNAGDCVASARLVVVLTHLSASGMAEKLTAQGLVYVGVGTVVWRVA